MRGVSRQRKPVQNDLERENQELRAELREAQETLRAIRNGEVDALVVSPPEGERVYTLRGAETPYRVIVETISEGAATLLPDGMILYANAAFSHLVKTPLERIIGNRLETFVWEPDRLLLPKLFERALTEITRHEINLISEGGALFPVYVSLSGLPIDDEKKGLSAVITDISERKRAEEELRKAHDELDLRVHERTRELKEANKMLQMEIADRKRAVEDLARSNRELEQFAYIASHDLQEPLRTVSSFVELLGSQYKGRLDENADKYINFATEGAKRMSQLISDLLVYSRVGRKEKAFCQVDLNISLDHAMDNLRTAIEESGARITYDKLPVVEGDGTQLAQLLQNLLSNAIKFRKKDEEPIVHVSAARKEHYWVLGVHDNGIGIDPRFSERIFTIFQRLHTREEYSGTGVGLALSKKIVERHGGRIWVESKPGEGSSFYFTIWEKI